MAGATGIERISAAFEAARSELAVAWREQARAYSELLGWDPPAA